ncbi:MAG TPA: sigma-70 family RNA polymerase sigma factor [Gemmatimonadaceae bacterium]|nr:sigma-70 family RNA polymerase sigma factor [Gemmatimonadaceae bacterium]
MNPSHPSGPYPSTTASEPTVGAAANAATLSGDAAIDAELVRRMQSGDERALGTFYDRWFPIVNGLVARMLKSADDVEDVVEETFWQVWRQASRFAEGRGSVQTWVLTIARSRALDRLRAARRRREDSIDGDDGEVLMSSADPTFVRAASDPSLAAEHNERSQLIMAALAELPREQREALELGYFKGLTQSEIAERTGQPLGTVKTRMRLAMQKLRDRLSPLREVAP